MPRPITQWEYTQLASSSFPNVQEEYVPVTKFPTSVHVELLAAGKIPDPYKDLNEADVQCKLPHLAI